MKDFIDIYAYKHDSSFHRIWTRSEVLADTKDYYVTYTPKNVRVIECKQSFWRTREPAVCYFSKKRWFNIIVVFREDEIMYYCNLASPILKELNSFKYIDYDLDVKYFVNKKKVKVLDRKEYEDNKVKYNYPEWIDVKVQKELKVLLSWIKNEVGPFSQEFRDKWQEEISKGKDE